jgi:DNA-binding beta-propeller fold protein YncE
MLVPNRFFVVSVAGWSLALASLVALPAGCGSSTPAGDGSVGDADAMGADAARSDLLESDVPTEPGADASKPPDAGPSSDAPAASDGRDVAASIDGPPLDGSDGMPWACGSAPGCACKPVSPGAPRSFAVAGTFAKLVSHPSSCLMFGLNVGASSQLVVFDTAMKQEVKRVELGGAATDLDLSHDGRRVVIAVDGVKQVSVVDTSTFAVTTVPTAAVPTAVEVDDAGNLYYAVSNSDRLHRMNLVAGLSSDVALTTPYGGYSALELSADGTLLYDGTSGTTSSSVYSLNVSGPDAAKVGADDWEGVGAGFSLPPRYVYLGPSGTHVYYDGYQLDAPALTFVRGPSGMILAEDAAASIAVSTTGVLDAQLLTRLAAFPAPVAAGALTASDHELWTFDQKAGVMTCTNVADFIGGKPLGVRESAAGDLASHGFAKLVADPKRPRLYGLDTLKRVVVEIDPAAGVALREVLVGSGPTDLDIDPTGTFLYVGHTDTQGIAQIDAESLTFKRFIPTRWVDFDVATLGADRIAAIDSWEWTSPSLIDVATGSVLDFEYEVPYAGQIAATTDGKTLFVADNPGLMSPAIVRYDVSTGKLQQVSKSSPSLVGGVTTRALLATPDGTSVFYAGQCLDGTDLTKTRYAQPDRILSIAPNGALAASSSHVYRVSDGAALAAVPGPCPVQAFSSDSATLYCTDAGFLTSVDLRGLR